MVHLLILMGIMWTVEGNTGINVSQSFYNSAWQGDETGSINWMAFLEFTLSRKISSKLEFKNKLQLAFGQTYMQDAETREWLPPQKSTDKIDNEAVLRFTMGWMVDPFIAWRTESQFYDNSLEKIKRYFNPVTLTQSCGASRTVVKDSSVELVTRLGLAIKEMFDRKIDTLYLTCLGVDMKADGGLECVIEGKYRINGNMWYQSKLRVYKAFFNPNAEALEGTPEKNYWKAPDINFENTLNVNITKIIQLNLYAQLIYDREQSSALQIKENFALGVNYKVL